MGFFICDINYSYSSSLLLQPSLRNVEATPTWYTPQTLPQCKQFSDSFSIILWIASFKQLFTLYLLLTDTLTYASLSLFLINFLNAKTHILYQSVASLSLDTHLNCFLNYFIDCASSRHNVVHKYVTASTRQVWWYDMISSQLCI